MAVMRYDPWSLVSDLQSEMNRMFDNRIGSNATDSAATSDWVPPVDILEGVDRYVLLADVPGVDPAAIDVHMENGILAIRGERKAQEPQAKAAYKRVERARGTFYRRFTLPDTAAADKVSATCRNGVLEVVIPKHEKVQPRKISVEG